MTTTHPNARVQAIAKQVLAELPDAIGPESTEASIAADAVDRMAALGVCETWYHDCPALVLLGSRSCLSVSGRDYTPAVEPVGELNLVTVDLSPMLNAAWGDCARSFVVEGGRVMNEPTTPEFQHGLRLLDELHTVVRRFATPGTRMNELCAFANEQIAAAGYENLDFLGNVGHSLAQTLGEREFIDESNRTRLGDVACFTFEPHIRRQGGRWGFKHEEVYRFNASGEAIAL